MNYSSLDSIVRGAVFENRLTLHYYVEFLYYALKSVKELNLDVLGNIKAVRLTVNEFNEVAIPSDYIDYTKVGYEYGQYVINLHVKDSFNRLAKLDGATQIEYPDVLSGVSLVPSYNEGYWYSNFINSYGEHLGKFFGFGNGSSRSGFKVVPERGVIQLDIGKFEEGDTIILEYIYFSNTVATSLISPYAEGTIKAYCEWQYKKNSRMFGAGEVDRAERQYWNELRKLRARTFKLTKSDIKAVSRQHFKQSPKM